VPFQLGEDAAADAAAARRRRDVHALDLAGGGVQAPQRAAADRLAVHPGDQQDAVAAVDLLLGQLEEVVLGLG